MAATTLFELERRTPGDGKPGVIYARDKRHQDTRPKPAPVNPVGRSDGLLIEDALDDGGVLGGSGAEVAGAGVEGGVSE